MFTRQSAQDFIGRLLGLCEEGELSVHLDAERRLGTRFNDGAISQHGLMANVRIRLTSRIGAKQSTVTLNETRDEEVLARAVRQVTALARQMPDDEEVQPFCTTVLPETGNAYSEMAEGLEIPTLGEWAAVACHEGVKAGIDLAGLLSVSKGLQAWGSSAGGFVAEPCHRSDFHVTATGARGSGWAEVQGLAVSREEVMAATARAIDKCHRAQRPVAEAAAPTVAILEPQAVGDLMGSCFLWGGWEQRATDEGRSAFSEDPGKLGELDLWSDPADARFGAVPFCADGQPLSRQIWLDKGIVQQQPTTRYWASKTNRPSKPQPRNLLLSGAGTSLEKMIATTENGVLVTRFWYIRPVDPKTFTFTGMTRDGIWRIHEGKCTHPLVDYRWNDSLFRILRHVLDSGVPTPTGENFNMVMPALKIKDFRFTSVSGAI